MRAVEVSDLALVWVKGFGKAVIGIRGGGLGTYRLRRGA